MACRRRTRIIATALAAAALLGGAGAIPATAEATRSNRVLVVLVDFQDKQHIDPGTVKSDFAQRIFAPQDSVHAYYSKVSGGRLHHVPALQEKAIGPLTVPLKASACEPGAIRVETQELLKAKGLDQGEDYDRLALVLPGVACRWSGLAAVPGAVSWFNSPKGSTRLGVAVHEFGHNLGHPHQNRLACDVGELTRCRPAGGSRSTPMGGGGPMVGLSAPELAHSGWLAPAEHQRVTASGTFCLESLYGGRGGIRALEVPLGPDRLLLEYRRPGEGLDASLDGVNIYRIPGGQYRKAVQVSSADTKSPARLTDTASGLTVAVTSTGTDRATVQITLDGKPPTASTATPSTDPVQVVPGPAPTDGGTVPPDHEEPADTDAPETPTSPSAATTTPTADSRLAATGADDHTGTLIIAGGSVLLMGALLAAGAGRRSRR
ncbi:hypothetical protein AB0N09_40785 [Streptomyces erythrochromogenes]|uniref:hypothetical protein n=1 Tax=Streptomyces erythrochromogenes TaxID=285574 RepID=UPI003427CB84